MRKPKVLELELLRGFKPDDIGSCKEPAMAARLLVCDRTGLELEFGVENMRNSNLCFTGGESGLYVVVNQDIASELGL